MDELCVFDDIIFNRLSYLNAWLICMGSFCVFDIVLKKLIENDLKYSCSIYRNDQKMPRFNSFFINLGKFVRT